MQGINWQDSLKGLYCCLRIERRNKTLQRKYYRLIERRKLQIAELGVCQECIRLYCRYLAADRVIKPLVPCKRNHAQMTLF